MPIQLHLLPGAKPAMPAHPAPPPFQPALSPAPALALLQAGVEGRTLHPATLRALAVTLAATPGLRFLAAARRVPTSYLPPYLGLLVRRRADLPPALVHAATDGLAWLAVFRTFLAVFSELDPEDILAAFPFEMEQLPGAPNERLDDTETGAFTERYFTDRCIRQSLYGAIYHAFDAMLCYPNQRLDALIAIACCCAGDLASAGLAQDSKKLPAELGEFLAIFAAWLMSDDDEETIGATAAAYYEKQPAFRPRLLRLK